MLEQKLMEKITKLKILKEKRKVKYNNNTNNIIVIKRKLKLFHSDNYALTMTLLPRKLVHQIF